MLSDQHPAPWIVLLTEILGNIRCIRHCVEYILLSVGREFLIMNVKVMKASHILKTAVVLAAMAGISPISAQNSLPAPGAGGSFNPAPSGPGSGPGMMQPAPPAPPAWGSPWHSPSPGGISISVGLGNQPGWQNQGYATVMACGYDAQGVWRVLPLYVSYEWNGVQYQVTVVNAWNPWTDMWNRGVDMPAYNTSYYLRGVTYDFYAPLSTGTYYFNLSA